MAEKSDGKSGFGDSGIAKPSEPIFGKSIDPATLGGTSAGTGTGTDGNTGDGTGKRKRGRPAGTGTGGTKKADKSDLKTSVDSLSKILLVLHAGVAGISKTPELVIDNAESDLLAGATVNLLDQFDITPDPKTQAAIALVVAAGTVYGPRVVAIKMRAASEKRKKGVTIDAENVVDFNTQGTA